MARIDKYRDHIQQILRKYSAFKPPVETMERELVTDTLNDHYQLVVVGWNDQTRIYGCIIHIDIKDEKIWIQHDGTEGGIANELVALGIPKEDIVLGFQAPYKRPYSGFAVN